MTIINGQVIDGGEIMRNIDTTVIRPNDGKKLSVLKASSSRDEIKFFINENLYVSAVDLPNGEVLVKLEEKAKVDVEEMIEEENKKSKLAMIKENLKLIFLLSIVSLAIIVIAFIFASLIENTFIYFLTINVICFLLNTIFTVVMEFISTSPEVRSKHAAEHMMINFLQNNRRLPKNMREIKKSSRFSHECGSRKKVRKTAESFIISLFSIIVAYAISSGVFYFFKNNIIEVIVFIVAYYLLEFLIIDKLVKKYKKMKFIVKPLKRILTNIIQCANTTKKVKDRDIILAYCSAKEWMKIVYPEFYNEEDDVFYKDHLKTFTRLQDIYIFKSE